jgi:type IV pilus assembly protein PilA
MKHRHINRESGFTLIELMIVIAIVGILAAIALPAYQNYTIRAKLSEVLAVGAEAKTSIAEYASAIGRVPSTLNSAGVNGLGFGQQSFMRGDGLELVATGTDLVEVRLFATNNATVLNTEAAGIQINLTGALDPTTRRMTWVCAPAQAVLSKYLPASCRG